MFKSKYTNVTGEAVYSPSVSGNEKIAKSKMFLLLLSVITMIIAMMFISKPVFADDGDDNSNNIVVETVEDTASGTTQTTEPVVQTQTQQIEQKVEAPVQQPTKVEAPAPQPAQKTETPAQQPKVQEVKNTEPAVTTTEITPSETPTTNITPEETNITNDNDQNTSGNTSETGNSGETINAGENEGSDTNNTDNEDNQSTVSPGEQNPSDKTDTTDSDTKVSENDNKTSVDNAQKETGNKSETATTPEKVKTADDKLKNDEKKNKENDVDLVKKAEREIAKRQKADKKANRKNEQNSKVNVKKNEKTTNITESDVIIFDGNSGSNYSGVSSGSYINGTSSSYQQSQRKMTRSSWIRTLTPYQQLIVNMRSTTKKPAVIRSDTTVSIREGRGSSYREVGRIADGALCYILEDGEWTYIESGEVRGFVEKTVLITGDEAESKIAQNGEANMPLAEPAIDPADNKVFNYTKFTTAEIPKMPYSVGFSMAGHSVPSVKRNAIIEYAKQFLGRPYVWGGTDLWNGADCSGFVQGVFGHFGIQLPRVSYQQCYVGERIDPKDAIPGDLLFYADGGRVYHVIIYIGDGMSIQAHSSSRGIVITEVDYSSTCWGTRIIQDTAVTAATQAIDLVETGKKASAGDEEARGEIIEALAEASESEYETYGYPRSVLIAQTIQDSDWVSFKDEDKGGVAPEDNNILGMNEELLNDEWESPWSGDATKRNVPQIEDGEVVYGEEMMRTYEDIESCMDDYAAFKTSMHPEIQGETDVDIVIEEGLQGNATDPEYQSSIKDIIDEYDLTQYDTEDAEDEESTNNSSDYNSSELDQIWAIVAMNDDASYEGALAVITAAANRADENYGGYGNTAIKQLTANGEFGYGSPESDESYQRYEGGNVPEYVKQAVKDCLEKGTRNHMYLNFRNSDNEGEYTQIGQNWYF